MCFMLNVAVLLLIEMLLTPAMAGASGIEGMVNVRGARDNRDAVIYIEKIPGKRFAPPERPVTLDQVNLTFIPHVLPVLAGTTVAFPNSDEIRHNVFSPTASSRFNLGSYPRATTKQYVFNNTGPVALLCNVHAEMSAYVFVTETPYFAVSDKQGRFAIPDVPPGRYVIRAWHERSKPAALDIDVPATGSIKVTFDLRR
jgi:hypothetical protein